MADQAPPPELPRLPPRPETPSRGVITTTSRRGCGPSRTTNCCARPNRDRGDGGSSGGATRRRDQRRASGALAPPSCLPRRDLGAELLPPGDQIDRFGVSTLTVDGAHMYTGHAGVHGTHQGRPDDKRRSAELDIATNDER